MNTRPETCSKLHDLVVVDASLEEHGELIERCERESVRLTLTNTGMGALRLVPSHCDAHWWVGSRLPDMTGLELLAMLRAIEPDLSVQIIADRYDIEEETEAYRLGAQAYRTQPHANQF
ncbi:MAG: response regulator [Planctomycetota bacterium]